MILLATLAFSAPAVTTATLLVGSMGPRGASSGSAVLVGEDVTLRVSPWLRVEMGAGAGATVLGAFRAESWLGPRFVMSGDAPSATAVGLLAQVGAGFEDVPTLHAWVGAGVGIPMSGRSSARIDLGYRFDDLEGGGASFLRVGLEWSGARPAGVASTVATDTPVVGATSAAAPPRVETDPSTALVWIPHPVCAWVPASEAASILGSAPPGGLVEVSAPGRIPVSVRAGGDVVVRLPEAPPQGNVVVVAAPGDRVHVGGVPVTPSALGIAVATIPEGAVEVDVSGGGRTAHLQGAVTAGYALWLRAPDPPPLVIHFQVGKSKIDRSDQLAIQTLAAQRGEWRFAVTGQASSEGQPEANFALAAARALAAIRTLQEAGVPPAAIVERPAELTGEGGGRTVQITPLAGGAP